MSENISFPLGLAINPYFCNREAETAQLIRNIHHCTHTVLISPRRYGKTSLAYRALDACGLSNARSDFYMTTTVTDIEKSIIVGVDTVLHHISNNAEILIGLVKDFVKSLKPAFEVTSTGLKIKLEPIEKTATAVNICEALQILDGVLKKKRKKAVLLLDEFQEIQRIAPDQGIEGAIRHVAQETKNFTLIFSGSRRKLLLSMFNDQSKPLYRLCDEIHLSRIEEKDYIPFIEKFAQVKWRKKLVLGTIQAILDFSERHPYYVNAICEKLFSSDKAQLPTAEDVQAIWDNFIMIKKKDVLVETNHLSIICKKLLVAIAHGTHHGFTSHKFIASAELSSASTLRALEYLEVNDFIEKRTEGYFIIDPLLKDVIRQLTYF